MSCSNNNQATFALSGLGHAVPSSLVPPPPPPFGLSSNVGVEGSPRSPKENLIAILDAAIAIIEEDDFLGLLEDDDWPMRQ